MGRQLLRVPYVGMPNLILGRKAVPELLQSEFTAENVARELRPLLEDAPARETMVKDLAEVRDRLTHPLLAKSGLAKDGAPAGAQAGLPAADRAAQAVVRSLGWG